MIKAANIVRGRIILLSAFTLIVAGCAYLLVPSFVAKQTRAEGVAANGARLQAAKTQVAPSLELQLLNPTHISVPRLGIEKTIAPGAYNARTGKWTLDNVRAFTAAEAATPLIYGHNTPQVFKGLAGVAPDEVLLVTTADGTTYLFRYVEDEMVAPNDTSILRRQLKNTLLVMTCGGSWNQSRRVLHFAYVGVRDVSDGQKQGI